MNEAQRRVQFREAVVVEHLVGNYRRLKVFISSTGDLKAQRDTVAESLSNLDIDNVRFEAWPSTPNPPIPESLDRLAECDAVVLLLGEGYGSRTQSGISVTQAEYRRAIELGKPVFVYLLEVRNHDPEQALFIEEVRKRFFSLSPNWLPR